LKAAHESKDIAQIDAAMEKINGAWQAASEEMQAAAQQAEGAGAPQDAGDATSEDDVQDVDFEEVEEEEK
jgi:molecular chaperone DnaK